ncbi:MAG: class I SAM-dependent methyltransferase [Tenuifilaceae bacterium]
MAEFWESKFSSEGAMWKFEPSDSALFALEFFKKNGIKKILIPGVGYGRNAKIFYQNGFDITGIEISKSAIRLAREENGLGFPIHHGSVIDMPFDNSIYDGIYCYATLHLFNKTERSKFISDCYNQLRKGGFMIFVVVSTKASLFGNGTYVSTNRYKQNNGLKVFFYDRSTIIKEFSDYGIVECLEIDEPIKFMEGEEPLKFLMIICKKGLT